MAFEKWVALVVGTVFLVYGYTAFFDMDHMLPPILKRDPVWPSTFPKILSVLGALAAVAVLAGIEKQPRKAGGMDIAKWREYRVAEALALTGGMALYALALRPLGFMSATFLFLVIGGFLLGERRYALLAAIPAVVTYVVWQLVDSLLGVHLPPLPAILAG